MSYEKLPEELKYLPQWVCWGGDKLPIDPKTGLLASVNDTTTWAPYAMAVRASDKYSGIGFVLTKNDPYTFIDLDAGGDASDMALQQQIYEYMDSYTEVSPSGKGLHIIVRANPPHPRKIRHIEVYGSKRYMTMTGNVYHDAGIGERQLHVEQLLSKLGRPTIDVPMIESEQDEEDDVLFDRMCQAQNGDDIKELLNGVWQHKYGSQSEADLALINHLVFYTQCPDQVLRMFRLSGLGQRTKAGRDKYLTDMIRIAADQLEPADGPYIDISSIRANLVDSARPTIASAPPPKVANCFPEGLMGHVSQYIHSTYSRPVPEIALAGAIGLLSGICGRAYNVSGTGLNMYTLLLAKTGTGKDAMAQGISRIRRQLSEAIPSAADFIGPNFASGQALARHLSENSSSFVSVFGEFGKQIARYSSSSATMADRALATLFLDLYSKSGNGVYLPGTAFADTSKNTQDMLSPSFSILGEATPETYYGVVDEQSIAEGLLPRFLVIEYVGPRVPKRDVIPEALALHPDVLKQLINLCDAALRLMAENACVDVLLTADAVAHLNTFDAAADARINASHKDVTRQLWNRAHLKALKLSALLAVGVNHHAPVVTLAQAEWAQQVVEADVLRVIARFETGDLGHDGEVAASHDKRVNVVQTCLRHYKDYDPGDSSNSSMKPGMQAASIIPHTTLRRHATSYPAFRKAAGYKTPTQLFEEVIKQLVEDEAIARVSQQVLKEQFAHRGVAYLILNQ